LEWLLQGEKPANKSKCKIRFCTSELIPALLSWLSCDWHLQSLLFSPACHLVQVSFIYPL
jgi:hypothetical protein